MTGTPSNQTMSLQDFLAVREFIYGRTGIFFSESKQYFLENRLSRRVAELKARDLPGLPGPAAGSPGPGRAQAAVQ